jgi:hypothetical protein
VAAMAAILALIVRLVVTPTPLPSLAIGTTATTRPAARRSSPGRVRTRPELDRHAESERALARPSGRRTLTRLNSKSSMPLASMVFALKAVR